MTLYELNGLVNEVISLSLDSDFWVEAELSEVREVRGHCYMELVQKDEKMNTPVAKAAAKCWANRWMYVRAHFERVTGEVFRPGLKVLLKVRANFHEAFGFAWIVSDIDPVYTMGDMARRRKEMVDTLKAQGVFDLQKELALPLFACRIAVVSSEGAAGYEDFANHLAHNAYGLAFEVQLFNAVMQGEGVERSVIAALNAINEREEEFDAVVLIRGGGGTSDLSGFDTLSLAENVANFPLPIITGIGHQRDESVLDLVSYRAVKTPTAAADLLIENLVQVLERVEDARQRITHVVQKRMKDEQAALERTAERIPVLFSLVRSRQTAAVDRLYHRLTEKMQHRLSNRQFAVQQLQQRLWRAPQYTVMQAQHRVALLSQRAAALDPQRILERGYSITLHAGKSVVDARKLKKGDVIETRLKNGKVVSRVE